MTKEKYLSAPQQAKLKRMTQVAAILRREEEQVGRTRELLRGLIIEGRVHHDLSINNIAKAVGLSRSRVGQLWKDAEDVGNQ